jgi:hypothetical protein
MSYSDSPGAIYPALRRLKEQGLAKDHVRKGGGLRDRRVYRLTPAGLAVLRQWLSQPVTRLEIVRDVDLLLMRFSLMDAAVGPGGSLRLLREAEPQLAEQAAGLKTYLREKGPAMPLSGRLALDFGVRSYDTLLQWTRDAIAAYAKSQKFPQS